VDDRTADLLLHYLTEVRSLPNEAAKTHRFAQLISELFPGSKAPIEFAAGIEKMVRIDSEKGSKRRHIDAYYGNAVIEFERSLSRTVEVAKKQLREYVAGLRAEGDLRPLVCIATDGVAWKIFRPIVKTDRLPSGVRRVAAPPRSISSGDVELVPLREFTLTNDTLDDFWIWMTNLLFREARSRLTAERFRLDFGAGSLAFSEALEALRRAWKTAGKESEVKLAFDTWKRYLTMTYGSLTGASGTRPEVETLFLKHTYLASIARFLVWATLSRGKTGGFLSRVADEVLSGVYFRREGIENLVEQDFFHWIQNPAARAVVTPVWERTLAQMMAYDLTEVDQDVLKGVYQDLVDPKDRHDLGEYYTPEWLCERLVQELLPATGFVSVIDPACGSGSFLRAAIAHLLRTNPEGRSEERLRKVLDSVVGIDIHPLAVTISRTTYVLALGSLVKATKRPIQIPVYMADSLFLPTEVRQLELGEVPSYEIAFGKRRVHIAEDLVHSAELFDSAIEAGYRVAIGHAETGDESIDSLRAYLRKSIPQLTTRDDFLEVTEGLWSFTEALASLIREKKNSIWRSLFETATDRRC
jgi:hypothetical protein